MTARLSQESADERPTHARIDFGEIYEQSLVGPLFRPWVAPLLDDVEFGPHDALLDIACGTGIVARVASERLGPGGRVVGVDLNPQMLAVARRVAPAIDWRQGDAGALPLGTDEQSTSSCASKDSSSSRTGRRRRGRCTAPWRAAAGWG